MIFNINDTAEQKVGNERRVLDVIIMKTPF